MLVIIIIVLFLFYINLKIPWNNSLAYLGIQKSSLGHMGCRGEYNIELNKSHSYKFLVWH